MINVNYQTYGKGFHLRLRIYKDGETKYVNVNKYLKGNLKKSHWDAAGKCFHRSAPYAETNNKFLEDFIRKYLDMSDNAGMSPSKLIAVVRGDDNQSDELTVFRALDIIIERIKENSRNSDGSLSEGYSAYEKTKKRLGEYCRSLKFDPETLVFSDITPQFVNNFIAWASGRGTGRCLYVSQTIRAFLVKADTDGWFDFETVKKCNWMKKIGRSAKKYESLTEEQCRKLIEMPLSELPKSRLASLYRDFCIFILFTCQSPCDAISLRWSDIQNINGADCFVFKRRKIATKQSTDCIVPINDTLRKIMNKWRKVSRDGYIFPIRSKDKIRNSIVENGDIKHFISRINTWLKKLSPILGCKFGLHTYVFRHTGITHYISKGVSHVYVANLAGTSVSNIEKIYYNNQADVKNRDMVLLSGF